MKRSRLEETTTIEWGESHRAVLFLGSSGDAFLVNSAGGFILAGLREGQGDRAIAARLAKTFDIAPARAARDVAAFLVRLRERGIVPNEE
ncbi:MAG: HPr-rel-A system PqqD family peptide chaperone [Planctomycetes bacterium]|nr:HPr-rel-A system PqqD family peptide chaperone [Planctomycetota bacterium]